MNEESAGKCLRQGRLFFCIFFALSLSIIFIYTSVVFAVQQIPTQKMSCTVIWWTTHRQQQVKTMREAFRGILPKVTTFT